MSLSVQRVELLHRLEAELLHRRWIHGAVGQLNTVAHRKTTVVESPEQEENEIYGRTSGDEHSQRVDHRTNPADAPHLDNSTNQEPQNPCAGRKLPKVAKRP